MSQTGNPYTKKDSLFIGNSNLIGYPVFLFAKSSHLVLGGLGG